MTQASEQRGVLGQKTEAESATCNAQRKCDRAALSCTLDSSNSRDGRKAPADHHRHVHRHQRAAELVAERALVADGGQPGDPIRASRELKTEDSNDDGHQCVGDVTAESDAQFVVSEDASKESDDESHSRTLGVIGEL